MKETRVHYFRCPYCGRDGSHSKKVSKSVGLFRVKQLYNNVLLMECRKCGKVCRIMKVGDVLQWQDMNQVERTAHTKKAWVNYTNEVKNG